MKKILTRHSEPNIKKYKIFGPFKIIILEWQNYCSVLQILNLVNSLGYTFKNKNF